LAPRLEHDPEKACPGLDPGWTPVFGKDHAQTKKTLVEMPPRGSDQSGAGHKGACSINDDGHCQLGEIAGGARASAGALGRERRICKQQARGR